MEKLKYSTKGYFERLAREILANVVDKRFYLLTQSGNKNPDWKGNKEFSCGVEVTRCIIGQDGDYLRYISNNFGEKISPEILKKDIENIKGFNGECHIVNNVLVVETDLPSDNETCNAINESINKKTKKLNKPKNYTLFDTNILFLYFSYTSLTNDLLVKIQRNIFNQPYKLKYDKIYIKDIENLFAITDKTIDCLMVSEEIIKNCIQQANPLEI